MLMDEIHAEHGRGDPPHSLRKPVFRDPEAGEKGEQPQRPGQAQKEIIVKGDGSVILQRPGPSAEIQADQGQSRHARAGE